MEALLCHDSAENCLFIYVGNNVGGKGEGGGGVGGGGEGGGGGGMALCRFM